jgi:hypothetical protein
MAPLGRSIAGIVLAAALAAPLVQPAAGQPAAPVRIRGYLVDVLSPTRIVLDAFEVDEDRTYLVEVGGLREQTAGILRVGADLDVEGSLDASAGVVLAARVTRRPPPREHGPETSTISTAVPIERSEKSFWDWLKVQVKEPDFGRRRSGHLTIRHATHFEIVANPEVQEYIADLGARLVPPFQRDLPGDDPAKIPFRFHVVRSDMAGAMAAASVILVYTRTFEILDNEAQLAWLLAHEIAHVTQKHSWRLSRMPPSPIRTGYARAYENQADRLALEYASSAGYDPREAATTWKLMARRLGFSPLRNTHESHPMRRALVMAALEANYHAADYGAFRTEGSRFREIAGGLKRSARR